jgi:transcriptional regulator with XRE-family HTH domain
MSIAAMVGVEVADETLAERVKGERARRGWSQYALAKEADITPAVVSRLEAGISDPSLFTAQKLARAFDMTTSELLGERKIALLIDPVELRLGQRLSALMGKITMSDLWTFLENLASLPPEAQALIERTVRVLAEDYRRPIVKGRDRTVRVLGGTIGGAMIGLEEEAAGYHIDPAEPEEEATLEG